jgi:hypothetical protein
MFLFELVFLRVRRRIAPQPELHDELLPFFIGSQFLKRGPLFIVDDVGHVLIQPHVVRRLHGAVRRLLRGTLQSRRGLPRSQNHRGGSH